MQQPPDQPFAWEPITPSGIAAFARATFGRLLLVQCCLAIVAAAATTWSIASALFPLASAAIGNLPERGAIRGGVLDWPAETPRLLAANRFVALTVNLHEDEYARTSAHMDVEFGFESCRVSLPTGSLRVPFPKGYMVAFNRPELEPVWGAWHPFIAIGCFVVVVGALLGSWAVLATLYAGPLWLAAFFANRELSVSGSWRVSSAALMPGALFMTVSVLLYRFGVFGVIHLTAAVAAHFLLGWMSLLAAAFCLPRVAEAPGRLNPFRGVASRSKVASNREPH